LRNKVVGIVGAGNIGRQVASKVHAFGATTQYYDPYRLSPEREKEFQLKFVELPKLIATSDIITLHVPLTDENKHMIGAEQIAQMKDHAMVINTARGGLVDDEALLKAVESGKLSGGGLDVVENEPLTSDNPLIKNSNIIVTPHIGGGTADIADIIMPMLVEDIKAFAAGQKVAHVVNKEYLN
jgi:phosphoglycerate dehydrogenase-like enzyme